MGSNGPAPIPNGKSAGATMAGGAADGIAVTADGTSADVGSTVAVHPSARFATLRTMRGLGANAVGRVRRGGATNLRGDRTILRGRIGAILRPHRTAAASTGPRLNIYVCLHCKSGSD